MKLIIDSFRQFNEKNDMRDIAEQVALTCFFGVAVIASVGHVV